jgi:twitching motility protein PilT
MRKIDKYLQASLGQNASDLHFISGDPVRARVHGGLHAIMEEKLTFDTVREAMFEIMDGTTQKHFEANDAADFAYEIEGVSRFRVNVFRHLNGIGAIFRAIPSQAMTLDELNMPDVVRTLCRHTQGMILVTGKTGSGKSTTLAAMIDEMNRRMKGHILTIEDPIEFVHTAKGCLISQREIGVHTTSFADALHSALREDPDVILVGEMRDLETISIAVTAAEMGILVMGTLHTNGAAQTVDRIINSFPADKQSHIRTMISTSLRGVVSQQLLPTCNRPGRAAALEVMINTPAVANLIRQGKLDQLETAIQSGGRMGMRTMDKALMELVDKGEVSGLEAYQQATNKHLFEKVKDIE